MTWINPIAGIAFSIRSADRAADDRCRVPVLAAQLVSTTRAAALSGSKRADEYLKAFEKFEKGSGVLAATAELVDFLSKNINPLICATSGLQVLLSDNKEETFMDKAVSLPCMFAAENYVKNQIGGKGEAIADKMYQLIKACAGSSLKEPKLFASAPSKLKLIGMIIEGGALVGASITAAVGGSKIGKSLYASFNNNSENIDTIA